MDGMLTLAFRVFSRVAFAYGGIGFRWEDVSGLFLIISIADWLILDYLFRKEDAGLLYFGEIIEFSANYLFANDEPEGVVKVLKLGNCIFDDLTSNECLIDAIFLRA